jgi:hypothetical protein
MIVKFIGGVAMFVVLTGALAGIAALLGGSAAFVAGVWAGAFTVCLISVISGLFMVGKGKIILEDDAKDD